MPHRLTTSTIGRKLFGFCRDVIAVNPAALEKLFGYIDVLESGLLKDAPSLYVSTGTYMPPMDDIRADLQSVAATDLDLDWMSEIESYQPYMQEPRSISSADAETTERLLVMAATADRFNKSLFPQLCSSGFMLELLRRLRSFCS